MRPLVRTQVNFSSKILDRQDRVIWLLKIFFKNSFVSPGPHEPTSGHESCLPIYTMTINTLLTNVIKNPIPAIKSKEVSYKVRWNQTEPYLSSVDTITKHMNGSIIISPTSSTKWRYTHSPLASLKVGKDAFLSCQPDESLNTVWSFSVPQRFLISL